MPVFGEEWKGNSSALALPPIATAATEYQFCPLLRRGLAATGNEAPWAFSRPWRCRYHSAAAVGLHHCNSTIRRNQWLTAKSISIVTT